MTKARPRLARKVRIRFDRFSGRTMLLWPERGLELNDSAAAVVALCDGDRTVDDVVYELALLYAEPNEKLRADTLALLSDLASRGLLEIDLERVS